VAAAIRSSDQISPALGAWKFPTDKKFVGLGNGDAHGEIEIFR
jgi:hypothetical protein